MQKILRGVFEKLDKKDRLREHEIKCLCMVSWRYRFMLSDKHVAYF